MSNYLFPSVRPCGYLDRQERSIAKSGLIDRLIDRVSAVAAFSRTSHGTGRVVRAVVAHEARLQGLDEAGLEQQIVELRHRLRRQGVLYSGVIEAFATVREVARRELGMAHYPSQLIGGWLILNGRIAEMATGEGKTLVATLPAATAALAGIPVHVISANDYLTRRDAQEMGSVYRRLGLSCGYVIGGMSPAERRVGYANDITYCSNKDVVFDYLKDQLTLGQQRHPLELQARQLEGRDAQGQLLQRGLHFAVVDEADSILIDEARTPLIISGQGESNPGEQQALEQALAVARELPEGLAYHLARGERQVELTPRGSEQLRQWAEEMGGIWVGRLRREELVSQALAALHLYRRDEHYLVEEGKVVIVDEHTGRVMPDRSWSHGLHQLIEVKEGVELTAPNKTLARISYQRFFRRYHHLGGMTGTAREVSGELYRVYGLKTAAVATHRPPRRQELARQLYVSESLKWRAVLAAVVREHALGRPVLVGTASVALSEQLSQQLAVAGLPHRLLNAKQDAEEAAIVARAGEPRAITIATNMAGRGTDIKLSTQAREAGGLHVIVTELHEAGRIDRQLVGRAARQGDPGSFEYILCLEDTLPLHHGHPLVLRALQQWEGRQTSRLGYLYLRWLQRRLERYHAAVRAQLYHQDEQQSDALAFAGRSG